MLQRCPAVSVFSQIAQILVCLICLQRISYAKRDSEVIAKMKGTYSAAGRAAKRKEGDDADAQAKRKRKPVAKWDFSVLLI